MSSVTVLLQKKSRPFTIAFQIEFHVNEEPIYLQIRLNFNWSSTRCRYDVDFSPIESMRLIIPNRRLKWGLAKPVKPSPRPETVSAL